MKIGLDLRMVGGGSGIDRYISELSHAILQQDKNNEYVLFFRDADQSKRYEQYGHEIVVTGIKHYSLAEQLTLPGILNKENLNLVHFPHFNVPIFYRKPFVVTIHDLTHTKFPGRKKSHFFHRLAYNLTISKAIRRAKKIIAVSENTKKEVLDYFRIDPNKVQVIYEAANQVYQIMNKQAALAKLNNRFGIAKPYILYVGVWRRYKNIPMLARAFDELVNQGLDYDLVLAGEQDPYYPNIKNQISKMKNFDRVKILGRVTDEELKWLYNGADLFVVPSLSEGFGLIALEAAACGAPIACSDLGSLREVLGSAAEYFDPSNLNNIVDTMKNVLTNPKRAEELANLALQRSEKFSWKQAAEQTVELYESINI